MGVFAKCTFCMSIIECGMALGRSRIWYFKILYLRHFLILAQFIFGIDIADWGEVISTASWGVRQSARREKGSRVRRDL